METQSNPFPLEAKPGSIDYVRAVSDRVPIPPYPGIAYTDRVPDTYDVAERAALALNALTASTNPLADYELYWLVVFGRNPVVMLHDWNDWCQLKFMEALPLLRIATGSPRNNEVDDAWQSVVLRSIGPDGLFYIPLTGRPWARRAVAWTAGVARADRTLTSVDDPTVTQLAHPYACSRVISVMIVYYLRDHNPLWLAIIQKMIDRLAELAIYIDDYAYFPALTFEPHARYDPTDPIAAPPLHITGGEINSRVPECLGQFYRLTGYEPARQLGEKLVRYTRCHMDYFGPGGEFLADGSFHGHTIYLLSMLELAMATGDREIIEFVKQSYTWAKSPASGACDLVGFFPEAARPDYLSCESCEIADMIALALRLTEAGMGDFYGDAERWARNHFAESQLLEAQWLYDQAQSQPAQAIGDNETADHTPERNMGAFAGWSSGNEWWVQGPGIMHCCTGNAARTLYRLWRAIVEWQAGELRVNLLLNRASRWADIYSHIPYSGEVQVKVKVDCAALRLHVPTWVETGNPQVTASRDGQVLDYAWEGRYLHLGPARAGETIQVTFPIADQTVEGVMGTRSYTLTIRGDTVVEIDPPGKLAPLYQRERYRSGEVEWKEVARFVADEDFYY